MVPFLEMKWPQLCWYCMVMESLTWLLMVCMILRGLVWFSKPYVNVFPWKVLNCIACLCMVLYGLTQLCTILVLVKNMSIQTEIDFVQISWATPITYFICRNSNVESILKCIRCFPFKFYNLIFNWNKWSYLVESEGKCKNGWIIAFR